MRLKGSNEVVASLKLKVMFTKELLKSEEEKKQEELIPAGDLAADADFL